MTEAAVAGRSQNAGPVCWLRNFLVPVVLGVGQAFSSGAMAANCEHRGVSVHRDFPGAAFATCSFTESGALRLTIRPEDTPINPSPWYAFRLQGTGPGSQRIELDYGDVKHRYLPDFSSDGESWLALATDELQLSEDKKTAAFSVPLSEDGTLIVAAQPLFVGADYREWIEGLKHGEKVRAKIIARSPENRPLWRFSTRPRRNTLLLLGRQHPPETTGAVAMFAFADRLLDDDKLAEAFRQEVGILAFPLLNPDGVARGHWRHNTGGRDLNRDWGPFSQPETRSVAENIENFLEENDSILVKSIDFHSTRYEVFYTQPDSSAKVFPSLLGDWLRSFRSTMITHYPDFELNRKMAHNADRPTAKSYFFERYGVASTTLEIGDATDPDFIRLYASVAAESFMRAWLGRTR